MLCCVSTKVSEYPTNENQRKHRKPLDSNCTGSSSGFSKSSFASSRDLPSSEFSPTSSFSNSSSGFSSVSPPSLFAFGNSNSFGLDSSNCFDLANSSSHTPEVTVGTSSESSSSSSSFSSFCSSVKAYPSVTSKRLITFSPSSTVQNLLNGDNDNSFVEKNKLAKDETPVLLPCAICARTFKPQSLEKHTRICERSALKKRKPFNSAKQRIQGTDLAEFLPKETTKKKIYQEEKQPVVAITSEASSWKQTHDEFLKAIRAVRRQTTDTASERQAVARSHVTVGVPTRPNEKGMCPTCNRQFSIKAYERHVAWCKEHATRVPITPATNVAKERLEARIKYRAPLLKNRKVTNREKYSPGSAVNLSNYSTKNSQPRTKESVSTPNCNNTKDGNETGTMGSGGGTQTHQKAIAKAKRSGLSREEIASGLTKSRLSDRSNRPAAEIEFGPMTNSSPCSLGINSRFSLVRDIPTVTSPLPTSRSVSKPETSRISSQDHRSFQRNIIAIDRKSIKQNNYNGSTHRQNIVSATSYGHPKINDITINDQVIGMTVQRCGLDEIDKKLTQQELITWKQISQEKNFVKLPEYLKLNDGKDVEQSPRENKFADSMAKNYQNFNDKSNLDFETFGTKKLNQTYLIRESLDSNKHLSEIIGETMKRSIVNGSRTEFNCDGNISSNNIFNDLGSNVANLFKSEVTVTSSPLKHHDKDKTQCQVNFSRSVSPVLLSGRAKLTPLDFEVINNDDVSKRGDNTLRSGSDVTSSPLKHHDKDKTQCQVNFSRSVSPVLLSGRAKLTPLDFEVINNDDVSKRGHNTLRSESDVTSLPLKHHDKDKTQCQVNFSRSVSPVLLSGRAKLTPLDFEVINNDDVSKRGDNTLRSGSDVTSLPLKHHDKDKTQCHVNFSRSVSPVLLSGRAKLTPLDFEVINNDDVFKRGDNTLRSGSDVTSSPLKHHDKDKTHCQVNFSRSVSPVLLSGRAKLTPLDFKVINNDDVSKRGDNTLKSGSDVTSSPLKHHDKDKTHCQVNFSRSVSPVLLSGRAKLTPLDFEVINNDDVSKRGDNTLRSGSDVTSLPLKHHDKDKTQCHVNFSRSVSPVLLSGRAKLTPLDFEVINNDDVSKRGDNTLKSGSDGKSSRRNCRGIFAKAITKLNPIMGCSLTCEDSLNFGHFEEEQSIDFYDGDNHSYECLKSSAENSRKVDLQPDNCQSTKTTITQRDLLTRKINLTCDDSLNFDHFEEATSIDFHDGDNHFYECLKSSTENSRKVDLQPDNCQSTKTTITQRNLLTKKEPKVNSPSTTNCDIEQTADIEQNINMADHQLLATSRLPEIKSTNIQKLGSYELPDFKFHDINNPKKEHFSENIDAVGNKNNTAEHVHLLDTLTSNELITKTEKVFDANNEKNSSTIIDNVEIKIISDKNHLSRFLKNTVTPTKTCSKSKLSKMQCISNKKSACKNIASKSFDSYLTYLNNQHSFQDINLNINHDKMFECLKTSRSVKNEVFEIISGEKSSLENTAKFSIEIELPIDKLFIDNSCGEKNNDSSIKLNDSVSIDETVSKNVIENNCIKIVETNSIKHVEKSSESSVKNIDYLHEKPVEPSLNFLDVKEVEKKTEIEATKNYQRCGTYVIERAKNPNSIKKHPSSDEFVEEKPLHKRRRTEQNMANDQLNKKSIFSQNLSQCSDENASKDLKLEINQKDSDNINSNFFDKSEKKLGSTEYKIETIDQNVGEISEKYVNKNFDYDSDNNLLKDYNIERPTTTQKKLSNNELTSYDLYSKTYSDSIVPQKTISFIFSPNSKKKRVVQDSIEIRRKFEKNMNLVRRSTDNLISSVETSGKTVGSNSSSFIVASCEIEQPPKVEKVTIQKLNFATKETIAPSKMSYCGFLPKISVDRKTVENNGHTNEKKSAPLNDTLNFWHKTSRNSTMRLINVDPHKSQQKTIGNLGQSNVKNLPPIVSASFRKERRRGSCKDYDPFLLAERQMNELLSDTCSSDQSLSDSLANRRISSSPPSNNYPLSHSSAFVKYPGPVTRRLDNSEKRVSLIAPPSEFDDLTADFSSDSTETNSISRKIIADVDDSQSTQNGFGRETKSKDYILGRRVIIDKSKALGTNEIMEISNRKNFQNNHKARKIHEKIIAKDLPHVTRSSSLRANSAPKAPDRKNNNNSSVIATNNLNTRSGSGSNNRNSNYPSLSGSNMSLSSIVSSEVEVNRSNSLFDELASSLEDDVSDMYPSLRSFLKNDSLSISSPVQSNRLRNGQISDEELSSPDGYHRHDNNTKLNADSAYSSLNRKYSNHGRSTNDVAGSQANDCPQNRQDGDAGSISSAKSKLPKFCHECGCKFPQTAKFCCECGIKRLAL